jgi:hypothetical protein
MFTPPSAAEPISQSNPRNKGSGSHHNYASQHTQTDYAPYLQEDLNNEALLNNDRSITVKSESFNFAHHLEGDYELRVRRIVVQERLRPITELTTAAELGEAFHGIFRCTPAF